MSLIRKHSLYLAWVVSLLALFGSLYYGEVLRMEPCRLCWYQRIGMFPLALFLGFAFYNNDSKIALYCLPLVAFGGLFASYQSLTQLFPSLKIHALCGEASSCTLAGYAPYLSFLAFGAIAILIRLNSSKKVF